MHFWDWKTGYNFQRSQASVQPGSLDSEAGIFAMTFDQSSSRLITCEADKTVKIYKEDDTAVSIGRFRAETGMSPRAGLFHWLQNSLPPAFPMPHLCREMSNPHLVC